VLWNEAVHTEKEVTANRLDTTIKSKNEKTCMLINVTITADRNAVQKKAGKKLKYKSFCTEIKRMWNLKGEIITVIIGATGLVTKGLRKNLEAMPEKHSIYSLQKTAVLGTSHTIQKVLQPET
jgi:23S rRNA pseudoU1915 N3-methylase RlmH